MYYKKEKPKGELNRKKTERDKGNERKKKRFSLVFFNPVYT